MPKNNNLKKINLPMTVRFGEKPTTKFVNNLEAINVELISSYDVEAVLKIIAPWVNATWSDNPSDTHRSIEEKIIDVYDAFAGKTLPSALETINLVFRIEGISLQEVTHILRHRNASFSAECSGDKWWTHKDVLVPSSIENSQFLERYKKINEDAKQLYCDMIDSKEVSIMDARYILTRCLSTYYFMRMNLGDFIRFFNQRIDTQIQPETDNILAMKMAIEVAKKVAFINTDMFDFRKEAKIYQQTARNGRGTNLYIPDEINDKFEYNEEDFIYQHKRDEFENEFGDKSGCMFNYMRDQLQLEFYEECYRNKVRVHKYIEACKTNKDGE